MMYLPVKEGRTDLVELFVEMFGLVMPEKVAEAVVKRDVRMIFDPVTKEPRQVVMPFMSRSEVMTLSVDRGWVSFRFGTWTHGRDALSGAFALGGCAEGDDRNLLSECKSGKPS